MSPAPRPTARAAAVLGVCLVAVLAGCGGSDGGESRCEDYAVMGTAERTDVVRYLLVESGDDDPSEATVDLTVSAVNYHCLAPDAGDDPISTILG